MRPMLALFVGSCKLKPTIVFFLAAGLSGFCICAPNHMILVVTMPLTKGNRYRLLVLNCLKNARMSSAKSSGSSIAAKCPPRGI